MAHCCSLTNILELSLPSFKVREEASIFLVPFFTVYFVLTYADMGPMMNRSTYSSQFLFAWGGIHVRLPPTTPLFLSAKGFFMSIHLSPLEFALLNAVELMEVGGG